MSNTDEQKGIESILKKALTNVSNESDLNQMRRDWFKNVVITVEKMGEKIESLSSESFRSKEELIKEINATKEKLREDLRTNYVEFKQEMKFLESRFDKVFDDLKRKVETINQSKDVSDLKLDFLNEINKVKDEWVLQFDPIKTALTALKTKLAMWALFWGIFGATILTAILKYFFDL